MSTRVCFVRCLLRNGWFGVSGRRWKEREWVIFAAEFYTVSFLTGKEVADRWYSEIKNYNFQQPGFNSGTGE